MLPHRSYFGRAARRLDCEGDEHDGREPSEDDEPDGVDGESALGWSDEEPRGDDTPASWAASSIGA
jgi:hypothetical protein